MSTRRYVRHHPARPILLSSDYDPPNFDDLPPSDPPEEDTEFELPPATTDENPFLTSDDETFGEHQFNFPSSEDIPLASLFANHRSPSTRSRRSSLPTPTQIRLPIPSSDDILYTPNTERKHQKQQITQKRLQALHQNRQLRLSRAEEEKAELERAKERLFDEVLLTFQKAGVSLADFLHYIFKPGSGTRHVYDWKWRGFFQHQETVKKIFTFWTTSDYNKTTRTFISGWIMDQAKKIVGLESKAISTSRVLRKSAMLVNEDFFLNFSLENITAQLRKLAPGAFGLMDAFTTTARQEKELKETSLQKKERV